MCKMKPNNVSTFKSYKIFIYEIAETPLHIRY